MKQSKSNDFATHIFHGHSYSFICKAAFILNFFFPPPCQNNARK